MEIQHSFGKCLPIAGEVHLESQVPACHPARLLGASCRCLLHFFGVYPSAVVAASALALCYALYQFAPQYVGPIEWAAFDTEIPGRQVYLFCGSNAAEFERFVSKLDELVTQARQQAKLAETEPTQSNTGE